MAWNVTHDPSMGVVVVSYSGPTTGDDLRAATSAAVSLGKEKGTTNFLVDASNLELAASIFDVYELPTKQYEEEGVEKRSRIAVIRPVSRKAQEAAKFYEIVCQNRGWFAQLFTERQSAIDWILANATSNTLNRSND
jgi:hypothetical protein